MNMASQQRMLLQYDATSMSKSLICACTKGGSGKIGGKIRVILICLTQVLVQNVYSLWIVKASVFTENCVFMLHFD